MKRLLAIILSLVTLFAFSACGDKATEASAQTKEKYNLDLTKFSGSMIYAKVNDMVSSPEKYKGKTVKMSGLFSVYEDTANNHVYYSCIIPDATACCQQGIEFVLSDTSLKYPDDYPEIGSAITIAGVYGTYYEGTYMYPQLSNAELLK